MGDLRGISELAGLAVFILLGRLTFTDAVRFPSPPVCLLDSLKDSVFAPWSDLCYIRDGFSHAIGVIEVYDFLESVFFFIWVQLNYFFMN